MTTSENVTYWEDRWRQLKSASPSTGNGRGLKRWDQMAEEFAKHTADQKQQKRREEIVAMLKAQGALKPGARVLDIGAGPGHWAAAMADTAEHITALEPSGAMAAILKAHIDAEKLDNVAVDQRTFQEIDLDREKWQGAFDLVFASMSPGVDGPDALYKMMAASRGYCYLSAFSGSGWQKEYDRLWLELFDKEMGRRPNDVIYPFNLLYAMGYRPSLTFHFWERKRSWTRDQAVEHYCLLVEDRAELTPDVKARIAAFVDRHCEDGVMTHSHEACQGIMVWDAAQRLTE